MKRLSHKVYTCGIDFQHEIGNAASGNTIYASVEDLKKHRPCWKGCGIVELDLKLSKWIVEQDMKEMTKNAIPACDITKYQIAETKKKIENLKKFLKRLQKERK